MGTWRIAAVACTVALLGAPAASADADFTDAAGDAAGGAPDVTDVSVINDAANRVVFGAKIAGGQALAADGEIVFAIDADRNPDTGSNGWDYLAILLGGERWDFNAWDGTQWVEAPARTVKVYFWGDVMLFAVDRTELGNTAGFTFFVQTAKYTGDEVTGSDDAPDGDGVWSYSTVTKTFGIATSPLVEVTKGGPKAGKPFVAGYLFGRTDSPEPAAGAKTTCTATVAGKRIAARVAQGVDVASCRVVVPKAAKGKLLKLTLTTTLGGRTATQSFTKKVR